MAKNTKVNLLTANLQSQFIVVTSIIQSLTENCYFSKKLSDLKLNKKDKQKLHSWIYSLNVKLVGNADSYSIRSDKIRYLIEYLTGKVLN